MLLTLRCKFQLYYDQDCECRFLSRCTYFIMVFSRFSTFLFKTRKIDKTSVDILDGNCFYVIFRRKPNIQIKFYRELSNLESSSSLVWFLLL